MTNPNENKTPNPNNNPPKDNKENDALSARLDQIENGLKAQLEEKDAQIAELSKNLNTLARSRNGQPQDDIVDTERKSANSMRLPVIEGSPVIKSEIKRVLGVKGLDLVAHVTTADKKEYKVPFGCDIKAIDFSQEAMKDLYTTSYENLQSMKFSLVDVTDLSGASKVEKGKVVSEGNPVAEIDRSSGTPVATGRKVRTSVRRDIRHYTIDVDGKKFVLSQDDLASIRI